MTQLRRRQRSPTPSPGGRACERIPGRPSSVDAELIRIDILRAARAAFIDNGYAGAGVEQIARQGGVAKITVYRRFGGKEQLFAEVAEQALREMHECFSATHTELTEVRPVLEHIVAQLDAWSRDVSLQAILQLVLREEERFPALVRRLQGEMDGLLATLAERIQTWQADGQVQTGDVQLAARQLIVLAAGTLHDLLSPERRMPAANWQSAVVRLLLQQWNSRA